MGASGWRRVVALVAGFGVVFGPACALSAATPPEVSRPPGGPPVAAVEVGAWPGAGGGGPALPTVAEVMADPLVSGLAADLRGQGFVLWPEILEVVVGTSDVVLVLGIDDGGLKRPVVNEAAMWRDAARLYVNVVWTSGSARAVVETRLGRDALQRPTFLHEIRVAGDDGTRLRAEEVLTEAGLERSTRLMSRDGTGLFVPAAGAGAGVAGIGDAINWQCVRSCFQAAGASLTQAAARCLVICLIAAGIGGLVFGGAAFLPILKACTIKCAKGALSKVGMQLLNCLAGC